MTLTEEITALGADTDDALSRFMGNVALYEKMLKKFPKVVEESQVGLYAKSGDYEAAASSAHALKGVTGNLSLAPLYKNYTKIVNLYRAGKIDEANSLLEETVEIQQKFIDVIVKYE